MTSSCAQTAWKRSRTSSSSEPRSSQAANRIGIARQVDVEAVAVVRVAAGEGREHQPRVGHRAGQRPVGDQRLPAGGGRLAGHGAERRLEAHDAAERGRDPDRAAAVAAERERARAATRPPPRHRPTNRRACASGRAGCRARGSSRRSRTPASRVLAKITAPASSSRRTAATVSTGTSGSTACEQNVVGTPASQCESLTVTGTPVSGPPSPRASAASAAAAASRARSSSRTTNASGTASARSSALVQRLDGGQLAAPQRGGQFDSAHLHGQGI